ncbi:MAG: hypothetical protein NDI82_07435 [Anaeromyxobacteraceae bacterium]|nr:hypothetical protein [Anaeromyxobacteraceae bacterium]
MTTTSRIALALSLASLVAACSGHDPMSSSSSIGADGGTVTTASGITLRVPAGALSTQTEVRLLETQPRDGAMARVEVEPRDLALAVPATLSFEVEDGNVRLSEIEHGPEGEIRHELEKRRHTGEVEVEVHRGGEIEMEHGLACEVECGAGFECDDGVCKVHVEDDPATHDVGDDNGMDDPATHDLGDDNGVDPAPAPPAPIDDNGNDGPGHT